MLGKWEIISEVRLGDISKKYRYRDIKVLYRRLSKVFLISPSRISIKENGNNVFISLILCVKCAMCMHVYDFHLLGEAGGGLKQ